MLSVGIVIRTKNRAVLLKRALESVLNQTYPHWQLVVVNAGDDPEIVNKLLAHYQDKWQGRLTVIQSPKSEGMEAASNLALAQLNTDLAVIHDDDDSWSPDFLLRMTQVYEYKKKEFPSLGGITSHVNRILETVEGNIVRVNQSDNFNQNLESGFIPINQIMKYSLFPQISFVFELELGKKIGFFDSQLPTLGYWDFHIKFLLNYDIWVVPETLAFYHQRLTATGDLGNHVIVDEKMSSLYRTLLENKWLRQDVQSNRLGLGTIMRLTNG